MLSISNTCHLAGISEGCLSKEGFQLTTLRLPAFVDTTIRTSMLSARAALTRSFRVITLPGTAKASASGSKSRSKNRRRVRDPFGPPSGAETVCAVDVS